MKKLFLMLILSCFVATGAWALFAPMALVATDGVAGPDCSGTAYLLWECDNVDVTVSGCADDDTSATANDQATITAGWAVYDDSADSDGHDYHKFTVTDTTLDDEFTIFIRFKIDTWTDNARLFDLMADVDNFARIQLYSSNDLLMAYKNGTNGDNVSAYLNGNHVSTGTEYILRYRRRIDAGVDHEITLFNTSMVQQETEQTDVDWGGSFSTEPSTDDLRIGNTLSAAQGSDINIDYVHIYQEWRDDDPND